MHYAYMITAPVESPRFNQALVQLCTDIAAQITISQVFFYGDATAIGTLDEHSDNFQDMIDLADEADIALHICSAAFQRRNYRISSLGQEDFHFKGLGQFIVETTAAEKIRVY